MTPAGGPADSGGRGAGKRRRVARFISKWRTEYSVAALILYIVVIMPATIILFPDSNLWLGVLFVLIAILDQLKDLADQLVEEDDN